MFTEKMVNITSKDLLHSNKVCNIIVFFHFGICHEHFPAYCFKLNTVNGQ